MPSSESDSDSDSDSEVEGEVPIEVVAKQVRGQDWKQKFVSLYGIHNSYRLRSEKRIDQLEVKVMDLLAHVKYQHERNVLLQSALDKAQAMIAKHQAKEL